MLTRGLALLSLPGGGDRSRGQGGWQVQWRGLHQSRRHCAAPKPGLPGPLPWDGHWCVCRPLPSVTSREMCFAVAITPLLATCRARLLADPTHNFLNHNHRATGLLLRGLREMITASGSTVSPLNSALSPEAGATVSPATATETAAPPPKGAAPFKVGLTPDFYNAEVCASDSSYDSRHSSALLVLDSALCPGPSRMPLWTEPCRGCVRLTAPLHGASTGQPALRRFRPRHA